MDFLKPNDLKERLPRWLSEIDAVGSAIPAFCHPALIVVDMQKDFLLPDGLLKVWGGPAVVSNVRRIISAFHDARCPVIFSRHVYEDPETDGGTTARWWNVDRSSQLLREGTWHAELHPDLLPTDTDVVITKRRYSAFFGTDLELRLRTSHVTEIVVTGVCTNICCEATAHDAFFRDFSVFMVADGVGATDETAQIATLRNFSLAYGKVVTADQMLRAVRDCRSRLRTEGVRHDG